jgi:hypothetical protein
MGLIIFFCLTILEVVQLSTAQLIGRRPKLLLALASTVNLGSQSHGTHDYILLSHDSGSCATLYRSANQEILPLLCNPIVHYRVHLSKPLVPVLGDTNPVHILTSYLHKIHFNNILPFTLRSAKRWTWKSNLNGCFGVKCGFIL